MDANRDACRPAPPACAEPALGNPMRAQRMQALQRRGGTRAGRVGALIQGRLAAPDSLSVAACPASASSEKKTGVPVPAGLTRSALRALLDHLQGCGYAATTDRNWPELKALDEFRAIWLHLRAEHQLRSALQPAPENAGPLNSAKLAHRSLRLMRDLSPAYLRHFLAHIDGLMWLEQFASTPVTSAAAPRAPRSRRRKAKANPPT